MSYNNVDWKLSQKRYFKSKHVNNMENIESTCDWVPLNPISKNVTLGVFLGSAMEEHNRTFVMLSAVLLICSDTPKDCSVGVLPPAHKKMEAAIINFSWDSCKRTSHSNYMKNIFFYVTKTRSHCYCRNVDGEIRSFCNALTVENSAVIYT